MSLEEVSKEVFEFVNNYRCREIFSPEHYYMLISGPLRINILQEIAGESHCLAPELTLIYDKVLKKVTYYNEYKYHEKCSLSLDTKVLIPVNIRFIGICAGHSTLLFIDNNHKKIIYYDSSGSKSWWYNPIYKFLKKEMKKHYIGYDFNSINDSCPRALNNMGKGICEAYTIFVYWMLIKYPLITPIEVIKFLETLPDRYQFMLKFICYLYDILVKIIFRIFNSYTNNKVYLEGISEFFYRITEIDPERSNDNKISQLFDEIKGQNIAIDYDTILKWIRNQASLTQLLSEKVQAKKRIGFDLINRWFNNRDKTSRWFEEHKNYQEDLNYDQISQWFEENEEYYEKSNASGMFKLETTLKTIYYKYVPRYIEGFVSSYNRS